MSLFIDTKIIFIAVLTFILTGCTHPPEAYRLIDEAEHQRANSIQHMDLETMFPEEPVRRLAYYAGIGDIEKAQYWLDQGVDVNAIGTNGARPIDWVWRQKNKAGITFLFENGVEYGVISETWQTDQ